MNGYADGLENKSTSQPTRMNRSKAVLLVGYIVVVLGWVTNNENHKYLRFIVSLQLTGRATSGVMILIINIIIDMVHYNEQSIYESVCDIQRWSSII